MLPKLARLKSSPSDRGRWWLLACSLTMLILPTWTQQARSQFGGRINPAKTADEKPAVTNTAKPGGTFPNLQDKVSLEGVRRPALPPMAPPSIEYLPEPMGAEKRILETLDEQVDFAFANESLDGIVATLAEQHGLQFVIDRIKLEEESVVTDAKAITLKLSGISLRSGLRILLKQKNLTFIIEDEVIKVTTLTDGILKRPTRTYPVRDLVGNVDVDYQLLSQAIQQSTGGPPDHPWMEADGEGGSVSILPAAGCLVVRQTEQGHDDVLTLLRSLRKANAETQVKSPQ